MSIAKMFEAGRMAAREDQERSALAKHLQPALGGDKAAQQAIYGVAPMRGMEVEGLAQQRQQGASEAARKQLADLSTLAARAPQMAAQVYPQWRAALEATGIATGLPEQYEEGAMEAMRAFAQGGGDEQYTLAPGSARYGADGRLIVERPFAPPRPDFQLYDGADGPVWLPKPGAGPMGAAAPAPPSGGVLDPVRDFGDLSGIPGVKTTSLFRDPERNARVGGVPGSFHTKGQAGDFVVPQDQKAQFIQRARDMGYDAIDEGDHVHVEPRRGATAASSFGPGQGVSAIPVQGVRPKPKAEDKPSALQERIQMARDMGASDAQIEQIVVGGSVGKPTEDQSKSAGYAIRMEEALKVIANTAKRDPSANRPGLGTAALDVLPDAVGNFFKPETRQSVEAAQLDALDAALTLNTGAAYTKEQLRGLSKAYFPQPGDGETVVAEKRERLQKLIETARIRANGVGQRPAAQQGAPVRIRSAAEYNALPSGATYIAPDGTQRRKK